VNGNGGASFFGFSGGGVQSMTVSSTDGLGFAIGDFFVLPLPEPGTWAMMLLGFAGIGTVMRRKNAASHIAQIA
jgi:hypothetical protein